MKKLITVLATVLFVASCASSSVDTTKVAKSGEAEQQATKAPKVKKNCNRNIPGSRVKRC